MGMTMKSDREEKKTISGIKPVKRFPDDNNFKLKNSNWMPANYKTQPIHDSTKHVMHNRNHTCQGVGRHS